MKRNLNKTVEQLYIVLESGTCIFLNVSYLDQDNSKVSSVISRNKRSIFRFINLNICSIRNKKNHPNYYSDGCAFAKNKITLSRWFW